MKVPSVSLGKSFTCVKCHAKIPTQAPGLSGDEGVSAVRVRTKPSDVAPQPRQAQQPTAKPASERPPAPTPGARVAAPAPPKPAADRPPNRPAAAQAAVAQDLEPLSDFALPQTPVRQVQEKPQPAPPSASARQRPPEPKQGSTLVPLEKTALVDKPAPDPFADLVPPRATATRAKAEDKPPPAPAPSRKPGPRPGAPEAAVPVESPEPNPFADLVAPRRAKAEKPTLAAPTQPEPLRAKTPARRPEPGSAPGEAKEPPPAAEPDPFADLVPSREALGHAKVDEGPFAAPAAGPAPARRDGAPRPPEREASPMSDFMPSRAPKTPEPGPVRLKPAGSEGRPAGKAPSEKVQPVAAQSRQRTPSSPVPKADNGAPKRRLGELLIEEGLVTQEQLDEALSVQKQRGGKVAEVLISLGHLDMRQFVNFLSRQPGIASIDLSNYEIPQDVLALIPAEFALKHEILPVDKLGKHLTVAMACPLDSQTIGELEGMTGFRVRPMLCAITHMQKALRRYYPSATPASQRTFELKGLPGAPGRAPAPEPAAPAPAAAQPSHPPSVADLLEQVDVLRTMPDTIRKVQEAMDDPASSAAVIAKVVSMDPAIAAKLLSLANSDSYGFAGRVSSVAMAASLIGLRETLSMVSAFQAIDPDENGQALDYRSLWKRAVFCSNVAAGLSKTADGKEKKGAAAAGLLYEIGRLALAQIAPDQYAQIGNGLARPALIAREQEVLGMSHPEAGHILARKWRLPQDIAQAIRYYPEPEKATEARDLVAVVALAAVMAEVYCLNGGARDQLNLADCTSLLILAGVDAADAASAYDQAADALREA